MRFLKKYIRVVKREMPKIMAKKKKTSKSTKNRRTIACKYLENINEISNANKPLCYCTARKFNLSPYNLICQICNMYVENSSQKTHAEMYVASEAKDFKYDERNIEFSDEDFVIEHDESEDLVALEELEEIEEIIPKKTKKKAKVVEEEEDFEIEKVTEEEEELIIGHEKEEKEDTENLDYEDEIEEGLGKKHGTLIKKGVEDEEDEEFEEEIEEFAEIEEEEATETDQDDTTSIDFEKDVIKKIKKIGSGDSAKEICPFCQKSKVSVLRHLSKCKRCPPEVLAAYKSWKTKKK